MVDHGADAEREGDGLLLLAASSGTTDNVKLLLEKGADVKFVEEENGYTALTLAATDGDNDSVELLIEHGADVNHKDKINESPLMKAASEGNIEVVKTLLKHNAELDTKNALGITALIYAVRSRNTDLVSLLLELGAKMTNFCIDDDDKEESCLTLASACGNIGIVAALIKYGADVNFVNKENETPLSNAAKGGYTKCVRKLLEHGAKVDIGNPVAAAVDGGKIDVAALLLKHGAKDTTSSSNGETLLRKAIEGLSFFFYGKNLSPETRPSWLNLLIIPLLEITTDLSETKTEIEINLLGIKPQRDKDDFFFFSYSQFSLLPWKDTQQNRKKKNSRKYVFYGWFFSL